MRWSDRGIDLPRSPFRVAPAAAAVLLLIPALLAPMVLAAAPTPASGTATVDGSTAEWSTVDDFFVKMTDAGYEDRPVIANLYLRYDCETEVLYGMVATVGDYRILQTRPENAYLRIDGAGKLVSGESGDDGSRPPRLGARAGAATAPDSARVPQAWHSGQRPTHFAEA